MKKVWFIFPIIITLAVGIFFFTQKEETPNTIIRTTLSTPSPQPEEIVASFEINTLGTKRIFTASMYHNLSNGVYITSEDPSIILVKKIGTTWADFFATLPMKLDKECLTTGTGQVFCTNESQKLKFYVNNIENPEALEEVISEGDHLLVTYD